MNLNPDVVHVELVHNPLQRAPGRAQTVVILAYVFQNFINNVHGTSREIIAQGVIGGERDHFPRRVAVHVDGWDVIVDRSARVEHSQTLHSHGVDGMRDRLVVVDGEAIPYQQLATVPTGYDQAHHNRKKKTGTSNHD